MTELLVGTRKGLFVLEGAGADFVTTARAFVGEPVDYAIRDPRTRRLFASVTSPFWGPKIWYTDGDPAADDWQPAGGVGLPRGGDEALKRIWVITPVGDRVYAGGDPGVLFASRDDGVTWELNRPLFEHPTRRHWQRDSGGLSVHSIAPWRNDANRLAVGISAAGVWLTDDGGATWRHGNRGIVADYLPEEARATAINLCVHHLERAALRPSRLFIQFHGGVYRSDDGGASWISIAAGLPSDFGFPIVLDPADPDSAFVIPVATVDRLTPGRVQVFETRDAGATWRARGDGLPQADAHLQILRQAFDRAGAGPGLELYFGATSGELFGSPDAGATWSTIAARLPAIASVRVSPSGT